MEIVLNHVYSEYSLLSSTNRIERLVSRAKELGYNALALCDRHVMYGAVPFYEACQKNKIKPIFGLEITIERNRNLGISELASLRLYAKNQNGFKNLLKLATVLGHKQEKQLFLTSHEAIRFFEDILIIIPVEQGPIDGYLAEGEFTKAFDWLELWRGQTKMDDWFLEVQPDTDGDSWKGQAVKKFSEQTGMKTIASQPCFFLKPEDQKAFAVIRAIRDGVKAEERLLTGKEKSFYMLSPTEMEQLFNGQKEALSMTQTLANLCSVHLELDKPKLPVYPNNQGKSSNEFLRELCLKGLKLRYKSITDPLRARLDKELAVIERMGFSDYFLIVWDFMTYAREQNILTGPGRGSAAGSLVAYVLQITNVDPIQYDLLFERFLNHERISMPDIDIDFPDHRRDEVIAYVQNKYGKGNVAQIITFGTLAARAVIRDVGKVLGTDSYVIEQLVKQIPASPGMSLTRAIYENDALKEMIDQSEELKHLWQIAKELEGLPRHASTHAAGVVISRDPLTQVMALQAGHAQISLTQATMDIVEKLGLLKFDFLGLRNLTLLETITTLIEKQTAKKLDVTTIPFDDEKTFQLLAKGETTGVFQLESAGMRQALKQLRPTEFEDIVAVNALYRPGPMKYIPDYVSGKHGIRQVSFVHPDLEPILSRTYGVLIYQEQIMEIASVMAGFSLAEADLLRRAISKKKKDELDQQRAAFIKGAKEKGYSTSIAEEIYELIERFADYGFNRSHAVAYSMISYYLAYLKVNYPLAFYTALLSSVWNQHDKLAHHLQECKDAGYEVLGPSVSKSDILFAIEENSIRFGLLPISHVGLPAARLIVEENKKEAFNDLFRFVVRINSKVVNKKAIENLIKAGAMDEFGVDRATMLYAVEEAIGFAQEVNSFQDETEGLFTLDIQPPSYREVEPLQIQEKLDFEKEALGFYLSGHPIEMWKAQLEKVGRKTIQNALTTTSSSRIAGLIIQVKKIKTKKGDGMAFGTLSDESGECELVLFPRVWKQVSSTFEEGELLLFEGRFDQSKEKTQFIVEKAGPVSSLAGKKERQTLYLRIVPEQEKLDVLEKVKHYLMTHTGPTPVILYYERTKQTKHLPQEYKINPTPSFLTGMKNLLGDENVILRV
ncbi:DNA polymerase III subunit alpha [Halalkalibacter krulwichiae]|uniref:DNA polymerase III subunit alpha n=1 Tax=Halalkalibacter krulwichiae TaxID=199441 RepID=A0A1X9ME69_9BACI|nr:DNA polymerase III subunit alpha [Halalkalibacter krulwichiae]ARK31706.1 DNA polymerase III subunit alpha [Halalkalibacter krulwichiae]